MKIEKGTVRLEASVEIELVDFDEKNASMLSKDVLKSLFLDSEDFRNKIINAFRPVSLTTPLDGGMSTTKRIV